MTSDHDPHLLLGLLDPWRENTHSIWIGSTLKISRNLDNYNFPSKLSTDEQKEVVSLIQKNLMSYKGLEKPTFLPAEETTPLEKQFLYEHFLLLSGLGQAHSGEAFLVGKQGSFLGSINLEDHLSLTLIDTSGDLESCFSELSKIENHLTKSFSFAFNSRFGFLSADPALSGTGLEVSCYVQAPALIHTGELSEFLVSHNEDDVYVSGLQGTLDEITGDLLVVRNNFTLGLTEEDILSSVRSYTTKLLVKEKGLRSQLKNTEARELKDLVSRAYAVLMHSYQIEPLEALSAISLVKLGVDLGWLTNVTIRELNALFFNCRRGHLLSHFESEIDQEELPHKRAEYIHKHLEKAELHV